jgi:hypothetical protein
MSNKKTKCRINSFDGFANVVFNHAIHEPSGMKIELEFTETEIGTERLAALSREAMRRRMPLADLIKEYLTELADDLGSPGPQTRTA